MISLPTAPRETFAQRMPSLHADDVTTLQPQGQLRTGMPAAGPRALASRTWNAAGQLLFVPEHFLVVSDVAPLRPVEERHWKDPLGPVTARANATLLPLGPLPPAAGAQEVPLLQLQAPAAMDPAAPFYVMAALLKAQVSDLFGVAPGRRVQNEAGETMSDMDPSDPVTLALEDSFDRRWNAWSVNGEDILGTVQATRPHRDAPGGPARPGRLALEMKVEREPARQRQVRTHWVNPDSPTWVRDLADVVRSRVAGPHGEAAWRPAVMCRDGASTSGLVAAALHGLECMAACREGRLPLAGPSDLARHLRDFVRQAQQLRSPSFAGPLSEPAEVDRLALAVWDAGHAGEVAREVTTGGTPTTVTLVRPQLKRGADGAMLRIVPFVPCEASGESVARVLHNRSLNAIPGLALKPENFVVLNSVLPFAPMEEPGWTDPAGRLTARANATALTPQLLQVQPPRFADPQAQVFFATALLAGQVSDLVAVAPSVPAVKGAPKSEWFPGVDRGDHACAALQGSFNHLVLWASNDDDPVRVEALAYALQGSPEGPALPQGCMELKVTGSNEVGRVHALRTHWVDPSRPDWLDALVHAFAAGRADDNGLPWRAAVMCHDGATQSGIVAAVLHGLHGLDNARPGIALPQTLEGLADYLREFIDKGRQLRSPSFASLGGEEPDIDAVAGALWRSWMAHGPEAGAPDAAPGAGGDAAQAPLTWTSSPFRHVPRRLADPSLNAISDLALVPEHFVVLNDVLPVKSMPGQAMGDSGWRDPHGPLTIRGNATVLPLGAQQPLARAGMTPGETGFSWGNLLDESQVLQLQAPLPDDPRAQFLFAGALIKSRINELLVVSPRVQGKDNGQLTWGMNAGDNAAVARRDTFTYAPSGPGPAQEPLLNIHASVPKGRPKHPTIHEGRLDLALLGDDGRKQVQGVRTRWVDPTDPNWIRHLVGVLRVEGWQNHGGLPLRPAVMCHDGVSHSGVVATVLHGMQCLEAFNQHQLTLNSTEDLARHMRAFVAQGERLRGPSFAKPESGPRDIGKLAAELWKQWTMLQSSPESAAVAQILRPAVDSGKEDADQASDRQAAIPASDPDGVQAMADSARVAAPALAAMTSESGLAGVEPLALPAAPRLDAGALHGGQAAIGDNRDSGFISPSDESPPDMEPQMPMPSPMPSPSPTRSQMPARTEHSAANAQNPSATEARSPDAASRPAAPAASPQTPPDRRSGAPVGRGRRVAFANPLVQGPVRTPLVAEPAQQKARTSILKQSPASGHRNTGAAAEPVAARTKPPGPEVAASYAQDFEQAIAGRQLPVSRGNTFALQSRWTADRPGVQMLSAELDSLVERMTQRTGLVGRLRRQVVGDQARSLTPHLAWGNQVSAMVHEQVERYQRDHGVTVSSGERATLVHHALRTVLKARFDALSPAQQARWRSRVEGGSRAFREDLARAERDALDLPARLKGEAPSSGSAAPPVFVGRKGVTALHQLVDGVQVPRSILTLMREVADRSRPEQSTAL